LLFITVDNLFYFGTAEAVQKYAPDFYKCVGPYATFSGSFLASGLKGVHFLYIIFLHF
jgi:hypothetical protein